MCLQRSVALPDTRPSAGRARAFVAEQCRQWGLEAISDDLTLPVSELVANAVVHAETPCLLTVSLADRFTEVAVSDDNPRPPILRPDRADLLADIDRAVALSPDLPADPRDRTLVVGEAGTITAGRGLLIVDAIADEWGVTELSKGKTVWFRIRVPHGWSFRSPCPCRVGTSVTPGGLQLHI